MTQPLTACKIKPTNPPPLPAAAAAATATLPVPALSALAKRAYNKQVLRQTNGIETFLCVWKHLTQQMEDGDDVIQSSLQPRACFVASPLSTTPAENIQPRRGARRGFRVG